MINFSELTKQAKRDHYNKKRKNQNKEEKTESYNDIEKRVKKEHKTK